ncbi:DoxX family protein [Candidatus Woesearchaeota archaeon]|nr:DoxX family protein [Candidatus Woesearchaeota archaeon]
MTPKTIKILYWTVTIIFCLANLFSGIAELFPNQQALKVMKLLGYPVYFLIILGVAKILGSIAIIQTKFKAVKEWAYAGFTIDYISASASFYFVNRDVLGMIFPLVFLAVLFVSYYLWKKVEKI